MADQLLADGALNLRQVPHLDVYRDFVFVHFDSAAVPPLRNYLGGAAPVLDLIADQAEHGLEVLPGAHEYSVPANWKLLLENSADGYHGPVTHSTYGDYLRARDGELPVAADGLAYDLGQGHSYTTAWGATPWGRPVARWVPGFGAAAKPELEATLRGLIERLGDERAQMVAMADRNLLIFPNLVVNDIMAVTVRTFWPVRHDLMEVNAWGLAPRGQSDAARARTTRNFVEFLGPAGFATPDDVEMLERCQQGYRATGGEGFNDLSRGMRRDAPLQTDEAQMRAFWRQWQRMVQA
jgi:p-cumate 2,3-dioxygenase alpha subunit